MSYSFYNHGNNIYLYLLDLIIPMAFCFLGMRLKWFVVLRKPKFSGVMKQDDENKADPEPQLESDTTMNR